MFGDCSRHGPQRASKLISLYPASLSTPPLAHTPADRSHFVLFRLAKRFSSNPPAQLLPLPPTGRPCWRKISCQKKQRFYDKGTKMSAFPLVRCLGSSR